MTPAPPRPRVDVGVVTWNTAELTATALRRLVDTDQGCDLRVLVHDNASADGTVEHLARVVPEAQVEAGSANLGFARAVNRLVQRSDAPWFLALNSDAWPEEGAVGALVASALAHPLAAAVAPRLERPDGSLEPSTHPFPSLGVAAIDALGGRRWLPRRLLDRHLLEGAWDHRRPRRVDWAVGAALLLRRRAIDDIGGFDERFFMYVEDLEWCWRAGRGGWEIRFEPAAVVRHVGNASGEHRFGDRRLALEAANLRTFLPEALGRRRALAYRALEAAGCARQLAVAKAVGHPGPAGAMKRRLKAELALLAPPPVDTDADADTGAAVTGAATAGDGPAGPGPGVRVSVVVPSRGRADRLARLFDALEAQTLPASDFEVLVVDDASPDETAQVVTERARTSRLDLRLLRQPVRRGPAAARNLGWQSAVAPVVAFTDDDCVPEPGWLAAGVAPIEAGRVGVVIGRTGPPGDQRHLAGTPFSRVMVVDEVRCYETCNAFYRRSDLKAVGGFDERFRRPSGEDLHLALAVAARGVEAAFAPDAVVRHDVRPGDLLAALAEATRWADLPLVVRDHPETRLLMHRVIFWKGTHPPAILAAGGLALAPLSPWGLLLCVPWLRHRLLTTPEGTTPGQRLGALPGALALDLLEVGVMARGSLRHRTVLL